MLGTINIIKSSLFLEVMGSEGKLLLVFLSNYVVNSLVNIYDYIHRFSTISSIVIKPSDSCG